MHICHARIKYDNRYGQLRLQFFVDLIMPQMMVEAFARSLIDKVMIEAFNVMDANNALAEKLEMLDNRQELAGIQSTRTEQQMQDRLCTDHNESETTELIEKMVHGLRNLQIGDSASVPSHLSKLEKQVKHTIHNIDNVSLVDPTKLVETHTTQGQGDVHQIVHDAVIEITVDPTCTRLEKKTDSLNEATKVSVSLLHKMIEELETKTQESDEEKENESKPISKEKIAAWEETEEQFIRTIENVDDPDQNVVNSLSESNFRNNVCDDFPYERASSSFVIHSTPFAKNNSLEEVAIEEITPSPLPDQENDCPQDNTCSRMKKKSYNEAQSEKQKKKGVLSRTRKLFRTIFGRRKK